MPYFPNHQLHNGVAMHANILNIITIITEIIGNLGLSMIVLIPSFTVVYFLGPVSKKSKVSALTVASMGVTMADLAKKEYEANIEANRIIRRHEQLEERIRDTIERVSKYRVMAEYIYIEDEQDDIAWNGMYENWNVIESDEIDPMDCLDDHDDNTTWWEAEEYYSGLEEQIDTGWAELLEEMEDDNSDDLFDSEEVQYIKEILAMQANNQTLDFSSIITNIALSM